MAMVMGINRAANKWNKISLFVILTSSLVGSVFAADAGNEGFKPYLESRLIYSDNIYLTEQNTESDTVLEVLPGFTLSSRSRYFKLYLDLGVQLLSYQQGEDGDGKSEFANPKLRLQSTTTLLPQWFFLDLNGQYDQRVTSTNQSGSFDNINLADDRSDFVSYQVSPYLQHQTPSGLYSLVKVSQQEIRFEDETSLAGAVLSDTTTERAEINVNNQTQKNRLQWSLKGNATRIEREREANRLSEYQDASLALGYKLGTTFSVMAKGGYTENFIDDVERGENGSYASGGVHWQPNNRFSLSVVAGDIYSEAQLRWVPSRRTDLELRVQESDVGINRGQSGYGKFEWKGKRSRWYAAYDEGITNEQILIQDGEVLIPIVNEDGTPFINPTTGEQFTITRPNFELVDDDFLRKRGEMGYEYSGRKFTQRLMIFQESREYEIRQDNDAETVGGQLSITIPIADAWTLETSAYLNKTRYEVDDEQQDFELYKLGGRQKLGKASSWGLFVQHTKRMSERDNRNYDENRAFVEWVYRL